MKYGIGAQLPPELWVEWRARTVAPGSKSPLIRAALEEYFAKHDRNEPIPGVPQETEDMRQKMMAEDELSKKAAEQAVEVAKPTVAEAAAALNQES